MCCNLLLSVILLPKRLFLNKEPNLWFGVSIYETASEEITIMATAVRITDDLVHDAKIFSKIEKRSLTGQIEYWARIGKCAEENSDLTYSLIKDILIGLAELEQGESSEDKLG